jgi:hypothetical protein
VSYRFASFAVQKRVSYARRFIRILAEEKRAANRRYRDPGSRISEPTARKLFSSRR